MTENGYDNAMSSNDEFNLTFPSTLYYYFCYKKIVSNPIGYLISQLFYLTYSYFKYKHFFLYFFKGLRQTYILLSISCESLLPLYRPLIALRHVAWASLYFLTRLLSLYFARRTYDFSLNPPRCARNFRSERDLVGDLRTTESANSVLTRLSKAMLMHRDEPRHVRGRRRREPSRREMEVHIGCDEIALWHCGLHERREDAIGVGGCWMSCALLSGRHSIRIH